MSTPSTPNPTYGYWYLWAGTHPYYQQPKVANLTDVDDYTNKAGYYVVVNSSGTGWTYIQNPSISTVSLFSSLFDVSWGYGNWGVGKYLIVGSGAGGINVDYTSVSPTTLSMFNALNDTFNYQVGNNSLLFPQVNASSSGLKASTFGIDSVLNGVVSPDNQLCYWYAVGGNSYYTFRPKMHVNLSFNSPQGSTFQGTQSGYDTTQVCSSNGSVSVTPTFYPLAANTHNINSSVPAVFTQTSIVTGVDLFTYYGNVVNPVPPTNFNAPLPGLITLTDANAQGLNGQKHPLLGGHSFRVQVTSYIQYHGNPATANDISVGLQIVGNDQFTIIDTMFDSVLIQGIKPGQSGKISSIYILTLQTGQSILPVFRNMYLGNPNISEVDFVEYNMSIDEL